MHLCSRSGKEYRTMADQRTFDALQHVATDYVHSSGEPPCHKQDTMQRETAAILIASKAMIERGERILFMADMFLQRHTDATIMSSAWDDLVHDFSIEDMETVHALFPQNEWPPEIPYPNLVALVGHIAIHSAVARFHSMTDVMNILIDRAYRLFSIGELYIEAQTNWNKGVERWDEAVRDMDDDDLEPVRKLFPQEEWPTKYGVLYPNLVALVKWTTMKRFQQLLLLAEIFDVLASGTR
jgi:hypothetical protein